MTIKVKVSRKEIIPQIIAKGDWIDLWLPEEIKTTGPTVTKEGKVMFQTKLIDLGIAMKLPKGFEAVVLPRSSTFGKFGLLLGNSQGIIDGK